MVTTDVNRLNDLVSDLLDIDHLETGQFVLQRKVVKVTEAAERAKQAVREEAESRGIALAGSGDTSLTCLADEDRVVQVLVNLLSNAIKYSGAGQSVSVAWKAYDKSVEISVIDHGCGIPKAFQDLIFERYKQVDPEYSKNHKGVGLGLHLCKTIVEAHEGTIGVQREEGQGSRFWFRLPNYVPDE